jgi:hypothetical protein
MLPLFPLNLFRTYYSSSSAAWITWLCRHVSFSSLTRFFIRFLKKLALVQFDITFSDIPRDADHFLVTFLMQIRSGLPVLNNLRSQTDSLLSTQFANWSELAALDWGLAVRWGGEVNWCMLHSLVGSIVAIKMKQPRPPRSEKEAPSLRGRQYHAS